MCILCASGIYIVFCDPFVYLEIQVTLNLQQQLELEFSSLVSLSEWQPNLTTFLSMAKCMYNLLKCWHLCGSSEISLYDC